MGFVSAYASRNILYKSLVIISFIVLVQAKKNFFALYATSESERIFLSIPILPDTFDGSFANETFWGKE